MANDKVALANLALAKVGAARITTFGDDSDEARAVSDVYEDMRDEVLAEHPWTFAMKRALLVLSADVPAFTDDGLSVVYVKPNDMIRIFFQSDPCATISVEQQRILSNRANLGVRYVFRNDNPSLYYPMFTTALATRIAAEICFNLTESAKKAEALFGEYEKIRLPRAIQSDSQQGTPMQAVADEWFIARVTSGGYGPIQPGQQTWHPA